MWMMNMEIYGDYVKFKSIHNDEVEMDKYVRTILRKDFWKNRNWKKLERIY